jgi:hypothetical protein
MSERDELDFAAEGGKHGTLFLGVFLFLSKRHEVHLMMQGKSFQQMKGALIRPTIQRPWCVGVDDEKFHGTSLLR